MFESLVGENHTFICAKGEYMAIAMYDLDKFKRINVPAQTSHQLHVVVGKSEDSATRLLGDIQAELEHNQRIIADSSQVLPSNSM